MFWSRLHPLVRKRLALGLVRLVAAGIGVLTVAAKYGLNVELDPRSSDFGKIRDGKTRWDIWGGNQQLIRTVAQMIYTRHNGQWGQWSKSSTTGAWHMQGHGKHFDPLTRFFEGKLNPTYGIALDVKRGEMFAGKPLTLQNEAKEKGIPLMYQDIWDAWHQMSPELAVSSIIPAAFGVGMQTYSSQKTGKSSRGTGSYHDPFSGLDSGGGGYSDPFSNLGP